MMKKLIVTADDFGPHPFINEGIKKAVFEKNVNTVSCMVTFNGAESAIRSFMQECKSKKLNVKFGLHISLTAGSPVLKNEVKSLTSDGTKFMTINKYDYDKVLPGDVFKEVEAQILMLKKIGDEEGFPLDHLTSHHGIMGLFPDYLKTYMQLSIKYNIPVRNPILISRLRKWGFLTSGMKREGLYRGLKILRNEGGSQVAINLVTMSVKNLEDNLKRFNGGRVRYPAYFIDTFYKFASDKRLRKILKYLPSQSSELVVHLGFGNYDSGATEKAKFNGISFDYFETRKKELDTLTKINVNNYLTNSYKRSWTTFTDIELH